MPHSQQRHGNRIIVPQRMIQGGFDFKFETDPYNVNLRGLLTTAQYTSAIEAINEIIAPSRSKKLDGALLAAGALMLPLAVWGIRHSNQTRRRKRLLKKGIQNFNAQYETLYMRWNRSPESCLTIERRQAEALPPPPQAQQVVVGEGEGPHANAEFVSDVIAMAEPMSGSPPRSSAASRRMVPQEPGASVFV